MSSIHVETGICGRHASMLCAPIRDDEALEAKLRFEKPVQGLAIAASIRVIDTVVGAHDVGAAGVNRVLEGPGTRRLAFR